MSDRAIAYVVDYKARMATQKYAKVRAGQVIGSLLGVCFSTSFGSGKTYFCIIYGADMGPRLANMEQILDSTFVRSSQWPIIHFRELWELMGVRQFRTKVSEVDVYF
jgi:hypothetical protein